MLLEDSLQKKRVFALFSKRLKKGELIKRINYNQWIIVDSEPHIFVDCQWDQIREVNETFVPYLLAVENLDSRYNLLINEYNSLRNNQLLEVGDNVDVLMEQQVIPTSGVVRYIGDLTGKKGIFFGIEIVVSHCHII